MNTNLSAAYLSLQAALKGATEGESDKLICLQLAENSEKILRIAPSTLKLVLSDEEDKELQDGQYYNDEGEASRVRFPSGVRDWAYAIAWERLETDILAADAQLAAELDAKATVRAKDREVKRLMQRALDDSRLERAFRSIENKLVKEAVPAKMSRLIGYDRGSKDRKALAGVASMMWSDFHWGETVDAEQVMGMNEYNLEIAQARLERVVSKSLELCFTHMSGQYYDAAVVLLGGDMLSGIIHEELSRTNDGEITDCVVSLAMALAVALRTIADQFGELYVPCVVGNHGRLEKDKVAKGKVRQNFDYLVYRMVKAQLSKDERITVDISPAADLMYRVYDTGFLLTHGDQVKSAGGVGGIWPSLLKTDYRKRMISQYRSRLGLRNTTHDYLCLGHFHQYGAVESIIVNGSLKGYDEYAMQLNCKPEPAQQALWITHPVYGITSHMPVIAQDLVREQELPPITPMQGVRSL